jgi:ascorbate-specific PTS system EIIC-type component UlaA
MFEKLYWKNEIIWWYSLLLDIWSILNNNVKHDYTIRVTMQNQCTISHL